MRIALAQLNYTVGAFDANFSRIRDAVQRAAASRADLVLFSEMAATGYPPRDLLDHPRFIDLNLDLVQRVAGLATSGLGILIGYVDRNRSGEGKPLLNAAALCDNGRVVGRYVKMLLPTYDVFDEDRYFEPGQAAAPLPFKGRRLGVTICEDVWNDRDFWPVRRYHRDPVCDVANAGADLLINISASPFTLAKPELRRRMIAQEAVKHGRPFFYLNQVGGNDELVFDGHSLGVDDAGREILRGRDFAEDFLVCDTLPESRGPSGTRSMAPDDDVAVSMLHEVSRSDEESAYRALVLGLGDYARKCGFTDVVLGLSGGIDSALTACIAADAMGPAHVLGVALPSRYSSGHSRTDAEALARALGIQYRVISIDAIFQSHLDALAPVFAGRPEDVTEENLQARVRGAVIMALANKFRGLPLSTGNKSELAVGYCTIYGDMCGGFAVLSDVPKQFVYRLAHWVNRASTRIPAAILTKPPSAELRRDQVDTDTLPPYDVLDPVLDLFIQDRLDVDSIVARGFDRATVRDAIRRVTASEFKRRQAAPGIKLSTTAFGAGRRYPIAADYAALFDGASR